MRTSLSLPLALIVAALVHAAPSRAQTPTGIPAPPDEALSETARELFAKGVKAAQQQRWDQCRAAFLAAYGVKPHPQIAGNLSACEVKLGMYRDAAEHVSIFLRAQRPDAPPERRTAADAVLKEASAKIAITRLDVAPDGAEVLLDGRQLGDASLTLPLFLEPGAHVIEVRQEGYVTAKRPLDAMAGTSTEIKIALLPVAAPPPVPGGHTTTARRSAGPGIILGAVAVAGVATGVGLYAVSVGDRSNADTLTKTILDAKHSCVPGAANLDPLCAQAHSAAATSDALHNAGVGTLIGAGAVAVAAGAYFVWPASRVSVVPVAEKSGAGLWLSGSF
jgi:PEGA domain